MVRSVLRVVLGSLMMLAIAAPASAQIKFEASVMGGYTFSEGVTGDAVIVPGVGTFNSIDVKSGGALGFSFGVVLPAGQEFGFIFSRQMSELSLGGLDTRVLGDMNIDSYHGYFAYNFLPDSKIRPFVMIGFGATDYGSVPYQTVNNSGSINGPARFSTIWSGGVKAYVSEHFAFRGAFVYTPTYISTEAAGWWCDPYWGCYLVGDNKYSNQFQINGGVTFSFGSK